MFMPLESAASDTVAVTDDSASLTSQSLVRNLRGILKLCIPTCIIGTFAPLMEFLSAFCTSGRVEM